MLQNVQTGPLNLCQCSNMLSAHISCQATMPMPSLGECAARGLESSREPCLQVPICCVGRGMLGSGPPALP